MTLTSRNQPLLWLPILGFDAYHTQIANQSRIMPLTRAHRTDSIVYCNV